MKEMNLNSAVDNEVCISEISMLERLRACETRDDAHNILDGLKRKELEIVARELYLLPKMFNKVDLIDRLIECTVGARLASEAIRDLDISRHRY